MMNVDMKNKLILQRFERFDESNILFYNVCRQEPYYGLEAKREVEMWDVGIQNGWICKCWRVGMGMGTQVSPLRNLCRDSYKGERWEEFEQCLRITNCNEQTIYPIQTMNQTLLICTMIPQTFLYCWTEIRQEKVPTRKKKLFVPVFYMTPS